MIAKVEKSALSLTDNERANLAERLPMSLPEDEDELAEALRRDREMDEDPSKVLSHEEFFKFFEDRRK